MNAVILVAAMALTTAALRFLPFLLFEKKTPPFVVYLGKVLPAALIGMLVVYCLKDVQIASAPHGLPELIAGAAVALLQAWKRNSLLSILAGTLLYMVLVQTIF
ncbi:MAG: AzlD domain-containing protein [Clostridia bacterium]|nr:AzlD domain-containing protein [Clostridia bacterium]